MRTIAHISDLHFGTVIPQVAEGLVQDLAELAPSLVIVSGDLTQRARTGQFEAAASYLARLPRPQLVVPGNHDVPLFDVARRFFSPLTRYRRYIESDLNPIYQDKELFVLGLNTARSLTWQSGRISDEQVDFLRSRLDVAGSRTKIVVTHHPFIPPPDGDGIELVGRASRAIPAMAKRDVDLLLSGHLHQGYAGDIRAHYPLAARSIIAVQAGTATSGRTRNEPNAYNLITIDSTRITITVRAWSGEQFKPLHVTAYARTPAGWAAETLSPGAIGK
ncbi:MAG: metallophosphoesterase [Opitutus sp.]